MIQLLKPPLLSLKRTVSLSNRKNRLKVLGVVLIAAGFFAGEYVFFSRMLVYFSKTELIGQLLIEKMLFMANFIFFAMLIFSNIITSISTYYTSDDLPLVLSTPRTLEEFFYARLMHTVVKSSWMVLLFGMPLYIAYGTILGGSLSYYLILVAGLLSFIFIASVSGVIVTMFVTYLLPARRFRELMLFLALFAFLGAYIGFRLIRPERFLNPQRFENVIGYLSTLRSSESLLLPSTWFSSSLLSAIAHSYNAALHMLFPLAATACGITATGVFTTYLFYRTGISKAQESKSARFGRSGILYRLLHGMTGRKNVFVGAIIKKDILGFFRDASQWSQLLLLGALVLVYVYNFTALPLNIIRFPTIYIRNIIAFFNLGLAAFVVTAIAARFAFPAVSLEGRALWLIKVSPNDLAELIRAKILYNLLPLLVVAIALVYFTNHVLGVFRYIMYLSIVTMTLLTVSITNIGVGLGTLYPKYHYENVADIAMGFGGFLFMIVSLGITGVVLLLQALPTYRIMKGITFQTGFIFYDYVWISLLYLLSGAVIVYPGLFLREKALKAIQITEG